MKKIAKILSKNDTGESGSHQSGFHIPQNFSIFFPVLNKNQKNPRVKIKFMDSEQNIWYLKFIYYNSKFFGGTRNEYRLTHTSKYLRSKNLTAGDRIIFEKKKNGYYIESEENPQEKLDKGNSTVVLTNKWKEIKL